MTQNPTPNAPAREEGGLYRDCPFDTRLARTPYLVLPKLAIQVMPMEWRERFDAMLQEMEDAGIETPAYIVLREGDCAEETDSGFIKIKRKPNDPWADYRHMQVEKVRALCPGFKGGA